MSGIMDTKILERVSDCEELVGLPDRRDAHASPILHLYGT